MGIEKQGSKSGNYVGGFLQLFDWNGKSRKKLFSSKSDIPEQSKQKKRCDGNLPSTRLQMLDEDDILAISSIKGSSDYSRSSSVNDEDFYGTKAPSVVARLMGLDSLPKSNILEPASSFSDSQSLQDSYFRAKNLEYLHDPQIMHSGSLQKCQKVMNRPIEKFQTEILPPKSAKSIPITHHKLLSPIKSSSFVPTKDAAHIMEAAVRIIEPGPQAGKKAKMPLVGSSSAPLKVKDLKEKVRLAQKPLKLSEASQRQGESSGVKNHMGATTSVRIFRDSEESIFGEKNKGKSVSLALQAKANVKKRESLNLKETSEFSPNQLFKSQPKTQKSSTLKKPSSQNGSSVLRQNNQKQNSIVDRGGKLPLKNGDSSSTRQRKTSKASSTSKTSSKKLGSEFNKESSSSSEKVNCKKRCIDGNYSSENNRMDKNEKGTQSSDIMDRKNIWDQDSGNMGSDVISFTFTAPMRSTETREHCNIFSEDSRSKKTLLSSGGMSASRFSFLEDKFKGDDSLSTLLEQKLKELTHKVELSQQKKMEIKTEPLPDNLGVLEEIYKRGSSNTQTNKFLDCRLPSPVSVLDHSSFAESSNSTETANSNLTEGSKNCSSVQACEVLGTYSLKTFLSNETDVELSDSASSTSAGIMAKRLETALNSTHCKKRGGWELEYINEILSNIEPMFKDYALGRTSEIIYPRLFDQLENRKGPVSRTKRRVLFDCVSECLDVRFRQYANGGYELWAKGLFVVRRKERLVEEVYKEIMGWSSLGDSMVDDLVDKDMSSKYGRWLDFEVEEFELGIEIESRVLNSLIDELVADILVL
ncbi:hypothetical protein ACJIZ3_013563 [Penstemon smallii]|uniref:DUF4378 domain-containing protein n=1 Tax=Penstemon smallii TaxID=265156 RepID=A0ABD3RU67_9LAMI